MSSIDFTPYPFHFSVSLLRKPLITAKKEHPKNLKIFEEHVPIRLTARPTWTNIIDIKRKHTLAIVSIWVLINAKIDDYFDSYI
jgi:hypothetical protein